MEWQLELIRALSGIKSQSEEHKSDPKGNDARGQHGQHATEGEKPVQYFCTGKSLEDV